MLKQTKVITPEDDFSDLDENGEERKSNKVSPAQFQEDVIRMLTRHGKLSAEQLMDKLLEFGTPVPDLATLRRRMRPLMESEEVWQELNHDTQCSYYTLPRKFTERHKNGITWGLAYLLKVPPKKKRVSKDG